MPPTQPSEAECDADRAWDDRWHLGVVEGQRCSRSACRNECQHRDGFRLQREPSIPRGNRVRGATRRGGRYLSARTPSVAPIRLRRLLFGALIATTFAFGIAIFGYCAGTVTVAAAEPYDPFGNEDCVNAGGHPLDCCVHNNGAWVEAGGPAPGSSAMGACAPPDLPKVPGVGPGSSGGAGPAGAQAAPTKVVPRPTPTPPQDVATPPPIVTFAPVPANPG